jgi:hypothetical protein
VLHDDGLCGVVGEIPSASVGLYHEDTDAYPSRWCAQETPKTLTLCFCNQVLPVVCRLQKFCPCSV